VWRVHASIPAEVNDDRREGFRIDRIPIGGAAGALVLVGGVAILILGVPPLRWLAVFAAVGGVVVAFSLWLVYGVLNTSNDAVPES
jgi:hypothetical protein